MMATRPRNVNQSVVPRLAEWVSDFQIEQAPAAVHREAVRGVIDAVGVAIAGAGADATRRTAASLLDVYSAGPCHATACPGKGLSPLAAALLNGVATHALDFDDTSYTGIFHASAVCWPAAFAACEYADASGEDFVTAFVAGVETAYAFADLVGHQVYHDGWWTTSLLGGIGSAAAAAKGLSLSVEQTRLALAHGLAWSGGMRAILGTHAKAYGAGKTARTGVEAALLARAELTAPLDAFENERGFLALIKPDGGDPGRLDRLGEKFGLLQPGMAYKRYPVCSAAQAAAEATAELMQKACARASDVERVDCLVTRLVEISLVYPAPKSTLEAQFSLPFAVATAMLEGSIEPRHLSMDYLQSPALDGTIGKVHMEVSDTLGGRLTHSGDGPEGAYVHLQLTNGQELACYKPVATGMPQCPLANEAIDDKFHTCCSQSMDRESSEVLLTRIKRVRELDSIRTLLCVPAD